MSKKKKEISKELTSTKLSVLPSITEVDDDFKNASPEDQQSLLQGLDYMSDYLRVAISKYGESGYKVGDFPSKAGSYINTDLFFEHAEKLFRQQFDEAINKNNAIKRLSFFCQFSIDEFEKKVADPFIREDKEFTKYFIQGWKRLKNLIGGFESVQPNNKKLNGKVIRLFCELVNDSGLIPKGGDEAVIPYCQRICNMFDLKYTDNVRKYFSVKSQIKEKDKSLIAVRELILPDISADYSKKIEDYIKSKIRVYN